MKVFGSAYLSGNVYVRSFVIIVAIFLVALVTYLSYDKDTIKDSSSEKYSQPKQEMAVKPKENEVEVPQFEQPDQATDLAEQPIELEAPIKQQFSLIASAYSEELKHPAYSPPLNDDNPITLDPNRYHKVELPILEGKHKAALRLEQYRYFYPNPIRITIDSPLEIQQVSFDLRGVENGKSIASQTVNRAEATFKSSEDWPEEIRVKAKVTFAQGDDVLTGDFRFYVPVGKITGVDTLGSEGPDMLIPVQLEVKKSGTFRLRASLFSASGQPIASLRATKTLAEGRQEIHLKAHSSVLKTSSLKNSSLKNSALKNGTQQGGGSEFELRYLQLEKLSDFPGQKTGFGVSDQPTYSLGSFDVSQLSDEPYQPTEQEKERLEFLKKLGQ
ncbi:hypothetical protein [Vibrio penaeicida]|uniref:Uncharacterized protein n=1 Tax=Vibrio penaeicida TaxID=104609 RepID=A0AAV5P4H2_9VIBR|nr:hypothetical protein [Vibrio penaeicida]RTZ22182.1 hypothetical protein EKN09_15400 [Vibrio penaeicida]GLQ76381.1 hypothetical protein GCM10007932_57440 [Vibrio penaeicida]